MKPDLGNAFIVCVLRSFLSYARLLRSRRSLVALIALAFWPGTASGLPPGNPGYVHRLWTVEHGLPQNGIRSLIASRDGYLWIACGSGLYRFDGLTFTPFNVTNTPALRSNWISTLHESVDGTLWIGTSKGLVRYRGGVFTRENGEGHFSEELIAFIREGGDGRLLASGGERVYQRDAGGSWTRVPVDGLTESIAALIATRRGSTWIASGRQLLEWRGATRRTLTPKDGLPDAQIRALHEDRTGAIWIGTERGLARLDPETGAMATENGPLASFGVYQLFEDRAGVLWMGGMGRVATRAPDGRVVVHAIADAAEEARVSALAQDIVGHIWFGIGGGPGGLHRFTRRRVDMLTRAQGLPCDNIASAAEGADGTIWLSAFCTDGGGLVAVKDGHVRTYRDPRVTFITALLPQPDGSLMVGAYRNGLFRFANDAFEPVAGPFRRGLTEILTLFRDHDGALWVGMREGLARYRDGQWRAWSAKDGLPGSDVRSIIAGRDRSLWIGTGAGVAHFARDRFVAYGAAQGVPPSEVRALHLDAEGVLWIGTYGGGLARLKDGRVVRLGSSDGLFDVSVHRILEDDRGDFWLSGDRGIRRVSRRDLTAIADGQSRNPRVDVFDTADGMSNAECNGMGQPAGLRTRDGGLWFPTQGGLARIDPAVVNAGASVPAPAATIEVMRIDGRERVEGGGYADARNVTVPPGAHDFEIRYTAPAVSRPDQLYFRYRLLGHHDGWIDAGTRRVAHFAGLAPGNYRFQVTARDGAGDWNTSAASLGVVLQARLYQRVEFRSTIVALAVLGLFYAGKWRLRQLDRRAQALEAIVAARTRELETQARQLESQRADLQAANAEIEATHARLLGTFNQLRVGVTLLDTEARVRFLSEATRPLVGDRPLDTLIGQPLERVLPIAPESLAAIRTQIRAPQPGGRITVEITPDSGQRYWAEIEVHPDLRDPEQRVLHLYDVTEAFELKRASQNGPEAVGTELLGESVAMHDLRHEIARIAGLDATVLIEGETGTGKELVARAIHAASRRKNRPFVAINCAGLTESLLASQLFGHRRGAFTGAVSDQRGLFEAAHGGTLLLDEIGDMPLGMQAHLLRVLEERKILRLGDSTPQPIDVRLLAATHRDLEGEVKAGRFREDLLYRIRVVRLHLPPLRSRADDVPLLALRFLRRFRTAHGLKVEAISREAMAHLQSHRWPGNVRQLKATVEGAAIRAAGPVMKLTDVLPELPSEQIPASRARLPHRVHRQILEALEKTGGNRSAAARMLGWPRSTFYKRLAKLEEQGVELPDEPSPPSTD